MYKPLVYFIWNEMYVCGAGRTTLGFIIVICILGSFFFTQH